MKLWLFLFALGALASIGDRSRAYQSCVSSCMASHSGHVPLLLKISFWSVQDDCRYSCQQLLTDRTLQGIEQQDLPTGQVVQFHGKWPFRRFLGMQEPCSVLFSFLNLLAHWNWAARLRTHFPAHLPGPMKRLYQAYPFFGINLWIWSMVFHTRDKGWTEKMDYFSAALGVIYSLYLAIIRLAHRFSNRKDHILFRQRLFLACALVYLAHISYLSLFKFDYGYNMKFNISIALLHNCLWYAWTLRHLLSPTSKRRPPHVWWPSVVLTLLTALMALEVLDFPPLGRSIDAHALWHLCTVPVVGLWYRFYLEDAHYLSSSSLKS